MLIKINKNIFISKYHFLSEVSKDHLFFNKTTNPSLSLSAESINANYRVLSLISDQGFYLIRKALRKNYKAIRYVLKWDKYLALMALKEIKLQEDNSNLVLNHISFILNKI